jgi:hypothetical protein
LENTIFAAMICAGRVSYTYFSHIPMNSHESIDKRSLALARAVAAKIDADPRRCGLAHARKVCSRWLKKDPLPALEEWRNLLKKNWKEVRPVLLDDSEHGRRLRQSDPFCGILTPRERWTIYRRFRHHETSRS